jgi:putative transposase
LHNISADDHPSCRHRIRSRTSLELKVIVLQHQLSVLKRQRPGRVKFFRADQSLWILLYRIWPRAINAMVLVKPATVLQ